MKGFWETEITYLKKVGPVRAELLQKELGISTFGDLLTFFPRKYVDRSQVSKISQLNGEESYVTLIGKFTQINKVEGKKGRGRLTATFYDGSGFLEINWFQGVRWLAKSLKVNEELALFGKPTRYGAKLSISHPEIDYLKQEDGGFLNQGIVPYYSSTEKLTRMGLDSRGLRTLVYILLEEGRTKVEENLPQALEAELTLITRSQALLNIHFPKDYQHLQQASRRLKFEELFFFQLLLARKRSSQKRKFAGPPFETIGPFFNRFYQEFLPFELTGAQKRVLKEIRKDVSQEVQMNRLVQGDVGSGKTMVAFMTMLMAIDNGYQAALMAPTAILAEQHAHKIGKYGEELGLKVGLLVGGQRKALRREILEAAASGEFDIVIGTHALIEDTVVFHKLGLVVVDEQHKFGVMQRAKLWTKGEIPPHTLVMSATPIPRTLAMTLYGDLDVSLIDELPPGRKPIKTFVRGESKRLEVLGFIKHQLDKGQQAYVIYPLVEESEKLDLLAATEGYEKMEKYFAPYRVGIVHGRMHADDKELEMQRFVKNETQVLVSTTVIEVGVDVPNSTVMLIENAERFGLSQLHQLRGRVGRGAEQAYCLLMAGYKVSKEGKARLKAMTDTTNGFKIAEIDLELRGPGDFLGTRQSGIPEFQLASLVEDQDLLTLAREHAFALHQKDPALEHPENQRLRSYYKIYGRRYAQLSTFA